MSDLAAAAATMGVPEALVKRSAEARARATGASVDEILAAWAGGSPAPTAPPPAPTGTTTTTPTEPAEQADARRQTPDASEEPGATAPHTVGPEVAIPTMEAAPSGVLRLASGVSSPPVLVGARQGVGVVMAGSFGLLIASLLLSFLIPSMRQPGNGVRSSNQAFSSGALEGRDIYLSQGCGTCHTQLIRNVITDVGLGPVTLDDTNQVIGYRRIGPDLAAIGARITDTAALSSLLTGDRSHPAVRGLSEADLANLLAYLRESR